VVVLATSETTTSGMLAVLTNTSVTGRDVAAVLAGVAEPGRHFLQGQRSALYLRSCRPIHRFAPRCSFRQRA
jgi:hypothetical protein